MIHRFIIFALTIFALSSVLAAQTSRNSRPVKTSTAKTQSGTIITAEVPPDDVPVLIKIADKFKYAGRDTFEYEHLSVATRTLGLRKDARATAFLITLITDPKVEAGVKSDAVKALGQIDAVTNKDVLFKALRESPANPALRMHAVEALAKTKDAQIMKELDKHALTEPDDFVMERLDRATQKVHKKDLRGTQPQ